MKQTQFKDLAKLATERCRTSVMSVGQLLDDDNERASLLLVVATDFIEGAASLVEGLDEEGEITSDEAFGAVLAMMFRTFGVERVMRALTSDPEFKALKAKREVPK